MQYLYLLFSAIIFCGCSLKTEDLSSDKIKTLLISAAEGNTSANDSLRSIFDQSSFPGQPEQVTIDTISVRGMKFFAAAVHFKDYSQNRFAIYGPDLGCYLVDRSLNGKLNLSTFHEQGFYYFMLEEDFSTNDSIGLKRVSVYRGDTTGFKLAFRSFTLMKTADTVFTHKLFEITPEVIRTSISAPVFSGINNLNDEYSYDESAKIYKVKKSVYFDEFVIDFVNSINDTLHNFIRPSINNKRSDVSSVFEYTDSYTPDYYLSLNEDWKELRNKPGIFLKHELVGSKFINEKLRSDIFVFRIPFFEEAESYVDALLENEVEGYYSVRYSADIRAGELVKKYFEYSCKTKKFLLILSALEDTYAVNKQTYFEIINTFYINC